jgi:hypothetical protein
MKIVLPEARTYLPGADRCIYCWPNRLTTEKLSHEASTNAAKAGKLATALGLKAKGK